jgi:nitrite reductase/ring-hydroxylating ferredoxin subunit
MNPHLLLADSIMTKLFLCRSAQVGLEKVLKIDIPKAPPLAVYNLEGEFYATENTCTHGEASLAEGVIEAGNIMCPYHGGMFDIKTGVPTGPPCIVPLRTYRVSVDGESLYANIE